MEQENLIEVQAQYAINRDLDYQAASFLAEDSGDALIFSASLTDSTKREIDAGVAGYSVSAGQGATVYGGVKEIKFDHQFIRIDFSKWASTELGVDEQIELGVSAEQLVSVEGPLREIVAAGRQSLSHKQRMRPAWWRLTQVGAGAASGWRSLANLSLTHAADGRLACAGYRRSILEAIDSL